MWKSLGKGAKISSWPGENSSVKMWHICAMRLSIPILMTLMTLSVIFISLIEQQNSAVPRSAVTGLAPVNISLGDTAGQVVIDYVPPGTEPLWGNRTQGF